ncbi:MAG: hypothetical protein AAGE52_08360 [Myxococcota bacterium]
MDAFVEVVNPDGTQERFPIEGNQATVGKSGSAQISIPAARELELEHLLIAPRGKEGCWVSTSAGAITQTMYKGKPFENGMVPWGAEFTIGRLRIRVTNKRATKGENQVNPLLLVALVVALGGAAFLFLGETAEALPSADGIEPPELFTQTAECPASDNAAENANAIEYRAHSRGDRMRYDPRDGVSAVLLYDQAAVCYRALGNAEKAREMEAQREAMIESVNAEYASRRLRLHHALQTEDWERAVLETRALGRLVSYIDGENDYVVWIDRTRRVVQAKWDKQRERRE